MAEKKQRGAAHGVIPSKDERIGSVSRKDLFAVKRRKPVPGPIGRAEWFGERAGRRAESASRERLQSALVQAETTSSTDVRRTVLDEALRLAASQKKELQVYRARAKSSKKAKRDPFTVGPAIEVTDLDDDHAIVVIPVDRESVRDLDLERIFVAEISDPDQPKLNNTFTWSDELQGLAGRVYVAGTYQAYALPRDPKRRGALDTAARQWRWMHGDAQSDDARELRKGAVRELAKAIGAAEIHPAILDAIVVNRAACSRWMSAGPFGQTDFNGIGRVTPISIHPSNGDTLIAGTMGGGVWRTFTGGLSWFPLMELQPTLAIGAVAYAPSNPAVMYAASGEDAGGIHATWPGVGVYRSIDNGAHWQLMAPVRSTRFSAIVVHPTNASTIYVAGNQGLHKSTDGGVTWMTNPNMASLFDGWISDVVLAHDDPQRVYIGVRSSGVWMSVNGGMSFEPLDDPKQLPSGAAAGWIKLTIGRGGAHGSKFLAAKMGTDGARIFRTIDGGAEWTELAANVAAVSYDEWCSLIAVSPFDENRLFAGAVGFRRTTNGGAAPADWSPVGGVHGDQQDMAFDLANPQRVWLANDGGVYRSDDGGATWTFRSNGMAITQFYDIDISQKDSDVLAGGAQDNGVYYRNTSGVWMRIPWSDGTQTAIDPTDPNILYFSAQNGVPAGLGRTIDGGMSVQDLGMAGLSGSSPWVTILKLEPKANVNNPAANRVLFVCGINELFRSINGGASWQRVENGVGVPFQTFGEISALEFAPFNPSILYLGTASGALYRGINGGATAADWTRLDSVNSQADALFPNVRIQSLAINPFNSNDVWVVFGGDGVGSFFRPEMILNPLGISHVFRTKDGGTTWVDASGWFPALALPDVPTSAVAISDIHADQAYVGTDVGVFRTVDGGVTWTAFQDGLPRAPVIDLMFNRVINQLVAGTMGRGIFTRTI